MDALQADLSDITSHKTVGTLRGVMTLMVLTNFESLMTMAASLNTRQCKGYGEQIHLECDEEISSSVRRRWEVYPKDEFDYEMYREIELQFHRTPNCRGPPKRTQKVVDYEGSVQEWALLGRDVKRVEGEVSEWDV